MVMTEEEAQQLADSNGRPKTTELGGTGNTAYSRLVYSDYNPNLAGRQAIETYRKMRNDGQVRGSLNLVKAPILAAEWFVEPASDSELDKKVARFVWWSLNNMSRTFDQFIREALLFIDYGYYVFEKVYKYVTWEGERRAAWRKFSPRHPLSIEEWDFDASGGIAGIYHNRSNTGIERIRIDIKDLLIFTFDEEGGNPEGYSLLRSAYKHWYFKENLYKVDAIQKERHGIGIPDIQLPDNYDPDDKKIADEIGRNLRTNEKAFITRPEKIKVGFLAPPQTTADALESAKHHGVMITQDFLTQFLNLGVQESGSRSTSESHQDIFIRSLKFVANLVRGVINQYAIPQMVGYNWNVDEFPKLRVRRVGEDASMRALSVALRNLAEVGIITPDPELERWTRMALELPKPSPEAMERDVEQRVSSRKNYENRVPKPEE